MKVKEKLQYPFLASSNDLLHHYLKKLHLMVYDNVFFLWNMMCETNIKNIN